MTSVSPVPSNGLYENKIYFILLLLFHPYEKYDRSIVKSVKNDRGEKVVSVSCRYLATGILWT